MGRRNAWTLEPLEGRELLSLTPVLGLLGPKIVSMAQTTAANPSTGNTSGGTPGGPGGGPDYSLALNQSTGISYYPNNGGNGITTDAASPRPNEVARRAFHATFVGKVVELPPRLYDQARQFSILAPGYTNQFLHGTLQMRYYTPAVGSGVTVNTGSLSMSDRSTQSGGVILADLSGDPTKVDSRGRPTQLSLVVNGGGGSGGIYSSSSGTGTINIKYQGNRVRVTVDASIFILGIGEPLDVFQSNVHG